jgi:hypothetical protein
VVAQRDPRVEVPTVGVNFPPTEAGEERTTWFLRGNDPLPGNMAGKFWQYMGGDEGWKDQNKHTVTTDPRRTLIATLPRLAGLADLGRRMHQLQAWCLCWWAEERPSAWEVYVVAKDLLQRLEAEYAKVEW